MPPVPRQFLRALLMAASFLVAGGSVALADRVTVFAAASMKTALDQIATGFADTTGHDATLSYAATSTLARQIQQGAPADVFISANAAWMDLLGAEDLIAPATRFDLTGNTLVMIAHGADAPPLPPGDLGTRLAEHLGDARLAMALVDAVPAGLYGKAALTSLGLWQALARRVVQTDNVRAALALVALGETPFGIVYASDAAAEPRVSIVATFPADTHPPIVYPAAALAGHDGVAAQAFLTYLRSDAARAVLAAAGFAVAP